MTSNPSILVIEDDPLYRTLYAKSIIRLCPDARVEVAGDGAEARSRLGAERFDLVVMDLNLPVLDGAALLAEIKRDPAHARLVVLVISAFDELGNAVRQENHPNVFPFYKPLRADDFAHVFQQCLALCECTRPPHEFPEDLITDTVDHGHIALYVGQDTALQRAVGQQFTLLVPSLIERLQRHLAHAEYALLATLAHDIRSAAAIIGAHGAARLAHHLIGAAQERNLELSTSLGKALGTALQAYSAALSAQGAARRPFLH